jgi:hypothetical protein
MRVLSNADFLSLWENGRALHPLDQGLLAIHAAFPEARGESVADWPVGQRNRALAELHCRYFGQALAGWIACPQCGEKLEFTMDVRALAEQREPEQPEPITIRGQSFRVPTSRDLSRITGERSAHLDPHAAATRLLSACRVGGEEEIEQNWSERELEEAGERMAAADPLAEIVIDFQCPVCEGSCQESLDLPAFLWAELEGLARRLASEVHTLAFAYGWSESQILSLSDARRRLYLEMVRA